MFLTSETEKRMNKSSGSTRLRSSSTLGVRPELGEKGGPVYGLDMSCEAATLESMDRPLNRDALDGPRGLESIQRNVLQPFAHVWLRVAYPDNIEYWH